MTPRRHMAIAVDSTPSPAYDISQNVVGPALQMPVGIAATSTRRGDKNEQLKPYNFVIYL